MSHSDDYYNNDGYDDDYYDKDHPPKNKKHYFNFDWSVWELWLKDAIEQIVKEDNNTWVVKPIPISEYVSKKFPVTENSLNDTAKTKKFLYLGSNQYDEAIWKKKYFICNPLQIEYINHLSSYAAHFVAQPNYYKGMFDILN